MGLWPSIRIAPEFLQKVGEVLAAHSPAQGREWLARHPPKQHISGVYANSFTYESNNAGLVLVARKKIGPHIDGELHLLLQFDLCMSEYMLIHVRMPLPMHLVTLEQAFVVPFLLLLRPRRSFFPTLTDLCICAWTDT